MRRLCRQPVNCEPPLLIGQSRLNEISQQQPKIYVNDAGNNVFPLMKYNIIHNLITMNVIFLELKNQNQYMTKGHKNTIGELKNS